MPSELVALDRVFATSNHYPSLLKLCCKTKNQNRVKKLHALILRSQAPCDTFLFNNLIHAYGKLGNLTYARGVFNQMPERNFFSWNIILSVYSKSGSPSKMMQVFNQMPYRDGVSWNAVISGHACYGSCSDSVKYYRLLLEEGLNNLNRITILTMLMLSSNAGYHLLGQQVHGQMEKLGFKSQDFVGSPLVGMYSKAGLIDEAKLAFDEMDVRDVVTCNTIMNGLLRFGRVEEARSLFHCMDMKDSISWTTMITGLTRNGLDWEAIELFKGMRLEGMAIDRFTFGSVLTACGGVFALKEGKQVHAYIVRTHNDDNVYVDSAIQNMYSKCRSVEYAESVFNGMTSRNVVSWTSMLVGYSQNGFKERAIWFFREMLRNDVDPDYFSLGSVVSSCASLASLEEGTQFHCRAFISGLISFINVSNALINLYGKCGGIEDSDRLFHEMSITDEISWTALISGYSQFGKAQETIDLFEKMLAHRSKPDWVTFIGVLSACSRARLVEKGHEYFESMVKEHGIMPVPDHYSCMIDLLSRAGRLEEARSFINRMPCHPDATSWSTLLSSCRFYGNEEIGKWAADSLLQLEPQNPAGYILLSGIYAAKGKWDNVATLRLQMRDKKLRKEEPGCSWIKHWRKVHVFMSDDRSSPFSDQIYLELEKLNSRMLEQGYVPLLDSVLHGGAELEKMKQVNYHSEKLAIAFGLIFVPHGLPIRVFKNLRVCVDCHNATKCISKITQREILVRDAARFHLFKDGMCSCGDFW